MNRVEIKIGGFGGQGVILAGQIIGRAASLHDNKDATLTQSFGPEARGGACSAQVVVSATRNLYPCVTHPDILVVMSQPAYDKFVPELRSGALLLFEESLVKIGPLPENCLAFGVPATRLAEELGRKMVLNIVMVGFLAAHSDVVSLEAMRLALAESVPKGTEKLNLEAFNKGFEYGKANRAPKGPA